MIKVGIAFVLGAIAALPPRAGAADDFLLVSFVEHFSSFDGMKGSLDGNVVLAGKYNDKGTRHEDFIVTGANEDGSLVNLSVTGLITTPKGTISLKATGTIHFTSDEFSYVEGPESITGGTGAYANATGKGSFVTTQDGAGDPDQIVGTVSLGPSPAGHLGNISTRAFVDLGERVAIGGFILQGFDATPVIVRALGPSLAKSGIAVPLPDPTLDLRDKNGTQLGFNDNWKDDPNQVSQISDAGLAPTDNHEAALFAILPPGQYTVIVADKNGKNGTAIVEVYNLSE